MGYRYKVSKTKAREYAKEMDRLQQFCNDNGIHSSSNMDSYYFTINGQHYRVSNHTVASSNRGAYHELKGQVRDLYHADGEKDDTIYITAGKTRIEEIYNNLKAGKQLDRRGNVR